MTIITRLLVVCLVLFATAACTTTKPPAAHVERIEARSTDVELANTRLVYIKEHDLTLQVPKRWLPRKYEFRDYNNETTRVEFQDLSGRNAHGIIWVLDNPGGSHDNIISYARGTMSNKTNSYNYSSQVTNQNFEVIQINGQPVLGWRTKVTVLGNFRDMALFYIKKPVTNGPDKWLMVFIRNEGGHGSIDMEKDIMDITSPIFTSFLDGPVGSEPIGN